MKKKVILVTATLLLVPALLVLGSASAHYRGGCGGFGSHRLLGPMAGLSLGGPMRRMLHLSDELELDKEQRNRIWEIMDTALPEFREHLEALHEGRQTIRNTVTDEDFDEARVRQSAEAQGKVIANLILLKTRVRHQVNQTLTPEQQERLRELRSPRLGH